VGRMPISSASLRMSDAPKRGAGAAAVGSVT
jgi:hypothetical protein